MKTTMAILASMVAPAVLWATQPNLIVNPDFEAGSGGWPTSWTRWTNGGTGTQSWATDRYVSNAHSIKTVMTTDGDYEWRQLCTGIGSQVKYRFRAYIYATNASTESHCIALHWYNGSTYLRQDRYSVTTANAWQEVIVEDIIPPSGADRVYILVAALKVGTYYFDDLVLMRKDENLYTISTQAGQKFPIGLYGMTNHMKRSYNPDNVTKPTETFDRLELIQNSDFSWPGITSTLPAAWSRLNPNPTGTYFQYVTTGTRYVRIVVTSDGGAEWRQWVYRLNPLWTYTFSAKINAWNVQTNSHYVVIQWFNDQGTYLGQNRYAATVADTWVTVGSSITPPSGSTRACVILAGLKTGSYHFDDVSLKVDLTEAQSLQEAKDAGFTFVNNHNIGWTPFSGLDLKSTIYLWNDMYLDPYDDNYSQKQTTLINEVNNYEAADPLVLWYGPDEPAWNGKPAQGVINGYTTVKTYDNYYTSRNHKVWVNHAPRGTSSDPDNFSTLAAYMSGLDLVSMDIYPVPQNNGHSNLSNQTISCVGDYVDILYNQVVPVNNAQSKPIWMVLQGCGWTEMSASPCWYYQSIEVHWYSAGYSYISRDIFDCRMTNEWCPVSMEYLKPPANAAYGYVVGRAYGKGDFYFDDISFWLDDWSAQYLNNAGFETNPNPATDWTFGGPTATGVWEASIFHGGTHSARITETSNGGGGQWCHRVVAVDPNRMYHLYGSMRADVRPTWTQTRFMAYDAIIHGARGIVYYGNYYIPLNSVTWSDLKQIAGELNGLSDALISNTSFRTVSANTNIETLLLKQGSGLCLIAANKSTGAVSTNLTISGLPLTSAMRTAGESGTISISNNILSDTFQAYQVHVYNLN